MHSKKVRLTQEHLHLRYYAHTKASLSSVSQFFETYQPRLHISAQYAKKNGTAVVWKSPRNP